MKSIIVTSVLIGLASTSLSWACDGSSENMPNLTRKAQSLRSELFKNFPELQSVNKQKFKKGHNFKQAIRSKRKSRNAQSLPEAILPSQFQGPIDTDDLNTEITKELDMVEKRFNFDNCKRTNVKKLERTN